MQPRTNCMMNSFYQEKFSLMRHSLPGKAVFFFKWLKVFLVVFVMLTVAAQKGFSQTTDGFEKTYSTVLAGSTLVSNSSPLVVNATAILDYSTLAAEYEQ